MTLSYGLLWYARLTPLLPSTLFFFFAIIWICNGTPCSKPIVHFMFSLSGFMNAYPSYLVRRKSYFANVIFLVSLKQQQRWSFQWCRFLYDLDKVFYGILGYFYPNNDMQCSCKTITLRLARDIDAFTDWSKIDLLTKACIGRWIKVNIDWHLFCKHCWAKMIHSVFG